MNRQMEMSFMRKGGLKDDGLNEDPVSGNKVPSGSMAKEVRDDIPAMLSEGEYVVPADVLRFYGVNFFEDLRNKAKSGLTSMEKNGRIGGTPLSQEDISRNMQQSMQPPSQPMPPMPPQPMAEGGTSGVTESLRVPMTREELLRRQEEKRQLDEMEANPKSREDIEEPRATINTYEVDGRMQNAIDFKDGTRMYAFELLNRFRDAKTAADPVLEFGIGKETSRMIDQYLEEANPTKEEFIRYFFEQRRLAKGGVVGASNGLDMGTYTSGYNPATARYAMFQGTSSQQQAQAAAAQAAAGEELSFMRPHYDKNGNKMMVEYIGTSAENAVIKTGPDGQPIQAEILEKYPLTEAEYNAIAKDLEVENRNKRPFEEKVTSDTSWMEGITANSAIGLEDKTKKLLGNLSSKKIGELGLEDFGALPKLFSGITKIDALAKANAMVKYAKSVEGEDSETAANIEKQIESLYSDAYRNALKKLGFAQGDMYAQQIQDFVAGPKKLPEGQTKEYTFKNPDGSAMKLGQTEGGSSFDLAEALSGERGSRAQYLANQQIHSQGLRAKREEQIANNVPEEDLVEDTSYYGSNEGIVDTIKNLFSSNEDNNNSATSNNKGGLATKRKTKKKSPRTTGLAGKR